MERILVATDFSTRSDRALRRAVFLAKANRAGITLVHVVDNDQPAYLIERQQAAGQDLLAQTAATITRGDGIAAEAVVTTGDAFAGILRAADDIAPDLIVVGPHRRQFLDTFVGTTAERTIRRARHPVLMANAVPAGSYNRGLLALGLDEASRAAVRAAIEFDILSHVDVVALHLFDAPALGLMKRTTETSEAIDHYVKKEEKKARGELSAFLSENGLARARQLLGPQQGPLANDIRICADQQDVDLIIMGTNQRSGLERLFLGSVAEGVLREARQDVLVVPADRSRRREG